MNVDTQKARCIALVMASVTALVLMGCTKDASEGIPAPGVALTRTSPVTDFLRYGDSLRFATDSPGVVTINRATSGINSELRVRSEVRLPNTHDAAYTTGRIIAKFETMRAPSPYGAPVGNAYLWVQDTGGGNFVSVLFWRDFTTGDTGRTAVPKQLHSMPRVSGVGPDCIDLSSFARDTTRLCCLCGDGRYNCPMQFDGGAGDAAALDSLLANAGRARRGP